MLSDDIHPMGFSCLELRICEIGSLFYRVRMYSSFGRRSTKQMASEYVV